LRTWSISQFTSLPVVASFSQQSRQNADGCLCAVRNSTTENWTLRNNEETRLGAFEMKGLRKILRVFFMDSKENK